MIYYLTSDEYPEYLGIPIQIIPEKILKIRGTKNALKVTLVEPIIYRGKLCDRCDISNEHEIEIRTFYLFPRHVGVEFNNLENIKCPVHVHITISKNLNREPSTFDDLIHKWWAVVYDNYEDARIHRWG